MEYSQEFRQIFIFRKSYVESIHRKVALDSSHYIRAFSLVIYINPNNFFNVLGWKLQHISLFCNPVIFPSCNICQLRRWQGNGFGFLFLLLAIFPLVKTRSQATTTLTLEITNGRKLPNATKIISKSCRNPGGTVWSDGKPHTNIRKMSYLCIFNMDKF